MIDPESYRMGFENASLDELLIERDKLIEYMHKYENHDLPNDDYASNPDPEVVYFSCIEYLREICYLIKIKMKNEDFYSKSCQIRTCCAIDEYLSALDEDKQEEELEILKNDDKKFYDAFMEWKKNKK